jgi:hypothetical protein
VNFIIDCVLTPERARSLVSTSLRAGRGRRCGAFPGLAGFFAEDWLGVPAAIWVIPAYLLVFMLLAVSYAGFSARMEG